MTTGSWITGTVRGRSYQAVLTPDLEAGGFTIEVPELPGVVTEADSVSDARVMSEAIELWLDSRGGSMKRSAAW